PSVGESPGVVTERGVAWCAVRGARAIDVSPSVVALGRLSGALRVPGYAGSEHRAGPPASSLCLFAKAPLSLIPFLRQQYLPRRIDVMKIRHRMTFGGSA